MSSLDRLTTLLDRFRLRVAPVPLEQAHLAGFRTSDETGARLVFQIDQTGIDACDGDVLFALSVEFGGAANPLQTALPGCVVEQIDAGSQMHSIVTLLAAEHSALRCGSPVVMARLGEVLVVQILRAQIERGEATTGLLAGLGHPRIGPAIVAMHDTPDRPWRNADLADVAGLSASRFKEVFADTVGATPAGYLRRWRLTLARQDLEKGDRVDRVAHRYGYRAPDGFSRAFLREFGKRPTQASRAG